MCSLVYGAEVEAASATWRVLDTATKGGPEYSALMTAEGMPFTAIQRPRASAETGLQAPNSVGLCSESWAPRRLTC